MNKCDLEEIRAQVDAVIASALADRDGWVCRRDDMALNGVEVFIHAASGVTFMKCGGVRVSPRKRKAIYFVVRLRQAMAKTVKKGDPQYAEFLTFWKAAKDSERCRELLVALSPPPKPVVVCEPTPEPKPVPSGWVYVGLGWLIVVISLAVLATK